MVREKWRRKDESGGKEIRRIKRTDKIGEGAIAEGARIGAEEGKKEVLEEAD